MDSGTDSRESVPPSRRRGAAVSPCREAPAVGAAAPAVTAVGGAGHCERPRLPSPPAPCRGSSTDARTRAGCAPTY